MTLRRFHGSPIRGLDTTPRSTSFEGRFGRMFRSLPPAVFNEADLKELAKRMVAQAEANPTPEDEVDDEENQGIDAGYTYLGQFIDHDLTFDPASSLQKQNDPDGLVDFRTPRFDLDNVYGRGPDDQPYLYEEDGIRMLLGRPLSGGNATDQNQRDVPRLNPSATSQPDHAARALIGDPRNDENVIVSQLQASMLRFHNRMVDYLREFEPDIRFEDVQRQVRWHYQWVVLHDFLPTIVGQEMVNSILPHLVKDPQTGLPGDIRDKKPVLKFYHYKQDPFIPIEFTVAAYRFGHSMIRPIYRLNQTLAKRQSIFVSGPDTAFESLTGFREFPANWAIDWDLFFNPGNTPPSGKGRTQKAYKFDTSLVNPLGHLPASVGGQMPSLTERNLLRGWRMGLPSGQAVAKLMQVPVLSDEELKIGKANADGFEDNKSILEAGNSFKGNAPLWFYILAEALHEVEKKAMAIQDPDPKKQAALRNAIPVQLGPVGGRIVAEVFIGLLLGDSHSFLSQEPDWTPEPAFCRPDGTFTMIDLLNQAKQAKQPIQVKRKPGAKQPIEPAVPVIPTPR